MVEGTGSRGRGKDMTRLVKIAIVLFFVAAAFGFEYWIYSTGKLQEHMTFLEFLMLMGRR